jgi:argininosuccinate synthase
MNSVIVLAYEGGFDPATVIRTVADSHRAAVVTMTADIGQARDVQAARAAALAAGARRAYVFDARDEFARGYVLPALQTDPGAVTAGAASASLAYPLIASKLAEVARLEGTMAVAHGGSEALSAAIRAADPTLTILTIEPPSPVRPVAPAARHLLQRPVANPALARGVPAHVVIEFDGAVPISVNGVALALADLMESLALLGGEHGIGYAESTSAPAALVLDTAYRALACRSGIVRIELLDGRQRVVSTDGRTSQERPRPDDVRIHESGLVNHA